VNDLFREQLLKAGLATKKQVKKASHEENVTRRKRRGEAGDTPEVSADAEAARLAAEAKAARDKELNRQREAARAARARSAALEALIAGTLLTKTGGDVAYKFADGGKVKTLHVTPAIQRELAVGARGIVRDAAGYGLVPRDTALALKEGLSERLVLLNEPEAPDGGDDPYSDYKVPDDLMW